MSGVLEVSSSRPPNYVVELSCDNCGCLRVSKADEEQLAALDIETDRATLAIQRGAQSLTRQRMQDDIALLSVALQGNHLLPEDF